MSQGVDIVKDTVPGKGRTGAATIGTTAVQIADSGPCQSGIEVRADTANTGVIYVGYNSDITAGSANQTDGFPLYAKDSKHFPVDSPNLIWVISDAAAQKVFWDAK